MTGVSRYSTLILGVITLLVWDPSVTSLMIISWSKELRAAAFTGMAGIAGIIPTASTAAAAAAVRPFTNFFIIIITSM